LFYLYGCSPMAKGSQREGYQVGVFKDGKLKHIMKLQEGQHYIREKTKKIKESKPKRECSKAQLEAPQTIIKADR